MSQFHIDLTVDEKDEMSEIRGEIIDSEGMGVLEYKIGSLTFSRNGGGVEGI